MTADILSRLGGDPGAPALGTLAEERDRTDRYLAARDYARSLGHRVCFHCTPLTVVCLRCRDGHDGRVMETGTGNLLSAPKADPAPNTNEEAASLPARLKEQAAANGGASCEPRGLDPTSAGGDDMSRGPACKSYTAEASTPTPHDPPAEQARRVEAESVSQPGAEIQIASNGGMDLGFLNGDTAPLSSTEPPTGTRGNAVAPAVAPPIPARVTAAWFVRLTDWQIATLDLNRLSKRGKELHAEEVKRREALAAHREAYGRQAAEAILGPVRERAKPDPDRVPDSATTPAELDRLELKALRHESAKHADGIANLWRAVGGARDDIKALREQINPLSSLPLSSAATEAATVRLPSVAALQAAKENCDGTPTGALRGQDLLPADVLAQPGAEGDSDAALSPSERHDAGGGGQAGGAEHRADARGDVRAQAEPGSARLTLRASSMWLSFLCSESANIDATRTQHDHPAARTGSAVHEVMARYAVDRRIDLHEAIDAAAEHWQVEENEVGPLVWRAKKILDDFSQAVAAIRDLGPGDVEVPLEIMIEGRRA